MNENEVLVGIDFSLNSPAITIKYKKNEQESYKFCSFFNSSNKDWINKNIKAFEHHKTLNQLNGIDVIPYNRNITAEDYTEKESQKINDAQNLSKLIVEYIKKFIEYNTNIVIKVGIEGFSYGSKGAAYNDLIMYNSFLRKELLTLTSANNILVFSPKHAKKLAGNGNADKNYMINAFIENKLNDNLISNTNLFKYCKSLQLNKNLKPIDDLIDSYFILNCIK
ncbi:MAG: hypothetical protein IKO36_03090 [Bacteroidaceae bacterium]|nr:hypothetical protein [Bacteroidaceae bacterium]